MQLVDFFKSAAQGYGTEQRVLLLHGPVGSLQVDHRPPAEEGPGALLRTARGRALHLRLASSATADGDGGELMPCPMHEEPLHLDPAGVRAQACSRDHRAAARGPATASALDGDLCPSCRYVYDDLLTEYDGDWQQGDASTSRCAG